ncbi:YciI family protein [Apilactobacillus quenuiae]|uniref:YciI family protein n=1 Tax=Apilactobacillus quenuiae TaxID=2008377 RepID=UPI000D015C88|nr:hypothetical protein [Apilactobacillus quenuiae]
MYLLKIKIKDNQLSESENEKLFAEHRQWFGNEFKKGNFLMIGPAKDEDKTGYIFAKESNKEPLKDIIKNDAFYPDKAEYIIHQFEPKAIADNITEYKGN